MYLCFPKIIVSRAMTFEDFINALVKETEVCKGCHATPRWVISNFLASNYGIPKSCCNYLDSLSVDILWNRNTKVEGYIYSKNYVYMHRVRIFYQPTAIELPIWHFSPLDERTYLMFCGLAPLYTNTHPCVYELIVSWIFSLHFFNS